MTPAEQLCRLYAGRPDMSFSRDVAAHVAGGYFIATPEVIGMIRPISHKWPTEMIANPAMIASHQLADCWFVWLLCGSLSEAVKHLPYPLPWFGFSQRGQPARFVEAEKVLAKIG